ncbi:MAG: YfiR family protein [Magnetococcales bacterium]|nr:YfiR family protein [Magnetococcales bacterium]
MVLLRPYRSRCGLAILALLLSFLVVSPLHAGSSKELRLQVAYLYNFTKFVTWPSGAFPSSDAPFRLCILGRDPFERFVNILKKKKVKGRPITIDRLSADAALTGCHIAFISPDDGSLWLADVQRDSTQPTLIVGDTPGFASRGGMINFIRQGNKLRFEVNREAVKRAGLKVSSTMLQIGRIVH